MKKEIIGLSAALILCGCSSSNLNFVGTKEEALYLKAGVSADSRPLALAVGYGKADTKIFPMARGQGFEDSTVIANNGQVTYACGFTLYPIGQDAIVKVEKGKKPLLEIFGISIGEKDDSLQVTYEMEKSGEVKTEVNK